MQEIFIYEDNEGNRIVALLDNGKVVEKYDEKVDQNRLEGNIYLGRVENVLLGMQAAFVDIGEEKNTFIHIKDIIPKMSNETGNKLERLSKHDIKNYIKVGMPILVQVKRDSTNKKGARVSTHITLPGRFVVLMPDSEFVTISQKIEDQNEKERLVKLVKNNLPKNFGAIIRTSAINKNDNLIIQDLEKLINQWAKIKELEQECLVKHTEPVLLYKNSGIVSKILVDFIDRDLSRIVTNSENIYLYIKEILKNTSNEEKTKLELKQNEDILDIYNIRSQLEKSENRKIWLNCGGFITIDKTEALTAIDVNSGKYVGTKTLEQTVFTVNKEATVEIARQLRLRDIGGIIVIDYIDMESEEDKQKIKNLLEENLKKDRSKTQVLGFTALNLLEMTRKHICSND